MKTNHSPQLIPFGQSVRRERESKGLSQEKLAELCGVHRTYIGGIERGERNPTLRTMLKISEAIGVPLSEIIRTMEDLGK